MRTGPTEVEGGEVLEDGQFPHPGTRHICGREIEGGEVLECRQLLQASVRHIGPREVESTEVLEGRQLLQVSVRHICAREIESAEVLEGSQLLQPSGRHVVQREVKAFKALEGRQFLDPGIIQQRLPGCLGWVKLPQNFFTFVVFISEILICRGNYSSLAVTHISILHGTDDADTGIKVKGFYLVVTLDFDFNNDVMLCAQVFHITFYSVRKCVLIRRSSCDLVEVELGVNLLGFESIGHGFSVLCTRAHKLMIATAGQRHLLLGIRSADEVRTGPTEVEGGEVFECRQILHPGIRDPRLREIEGGEVFECRQFLQAGVRHPRLREIEGGEVFECRQRHEFSVCHLRVRQINDFTILFDPSLELFYRLDHSILGGIGPNKRWSDEATERDHEKSHGVLLPYRCPTGNGRRVPELFNRVLKTPEENAINILRELSTGGYSSRGHRPRYSQTHQSAQGVAISRASLLAQS